MDLSGDWPGDMWDEEGNGSLFNLTEMEPSNNFTLVGTCAAKSLSLPTTLPFHIALTTTVQVIQSICYIIIFLLGLFLNTVVIVLVVKYKKLQSRSFIIALQVVVSNVIILLTVYLLRPITAIANQWLFGEYMCIITGFLYITYLLTRSVLMFAFVVDRFLSVFLPYSYPKHSSKIMIPLCVATWVFAIVARAIGFPGILDCYTFRLSAHLCIHSSGCSPSCAIATNTSISFLFGPTTIIPVILYALLYWKSRKIRKSQAAMIPAAAIGTEAEKVLRNLRKREGKATITFFLLFISVFALTTPAIIITIIATTLARTMGPSPIAYVISSISSTLTACLVIVDPIVILRNSDVRDVLAQIKRRFFPSTSTNATRQAAEN